MFPGEHFANETTCYDILNRASNEQKYLAILNKKVQELNSSMPLHSIMDTTRSGQHGLRERWTDWCNASGADFGRVPSSNTGDKQLDAFVWTQRGGVSDGTNDRGSRTYNSDCRKIDAFEPMPERWVWSQAYFEMLLENWSQRGLLRERGGEEVRAAQCG